MERTLASVWTHSKALAGGLILAFHVLLLITYAFYVQNAIGERVARVKVAVAGLENKWPPGGLQPVYRPSLPGSIRLFLTLAMILHFSRRVPW